LSRGFSKFQWEIKGFYFSMGNHRFILNISTGNHGSISQQEIMGFNLTTVLNISMGKISQREITMLNISMGHHGFQFLNLYFTTGNCGFLLWEIISQWEIMGSYFSTGNHRFLFLNGKSWGSISQQEIYMDNHHFEYINIFNHTSRIKHL
jgi:hypothetical protein